MKRKLYLLLCVCCLALAVLAAYNLISDQADYQAATDYYDSFANTFVEYTAEPADAPKPTDTPKPAKIAIPWIKSAQAETVDAAETAPPTASPAAGLNPENPTYTLEQPPISVDFEKLHWVNPEIVGWIYCADTPINYPVLQGADNEKYLNTQPDGKTSKSGSIFIDCNCEADFTSDNTIVYGHNRKNGMFATLPRYAHQAYYEAHPTLWLLTPTRNYRVDVFAGFAVRATDWVYEINLFKDKFREEFLERCLKASNFKTAKEPSVENRVLTLSTCYYAGTTSDDGRYVIMGSLIPCISAGGQEAGN